MHDPNLDLSGTTAVVLDVDGTIAGPDHRVSPRTRAAMADLEQLGVPVVLATGRSRANVLDVAATVGLRTPGVSCNGAVVTDPVSGDDLRVQTMDPAEAAALRTVHEETGYAFTWWTVRGIYTTTEQLRDLLMAFGDPDVQVAVPPERMPDDVVKAMIHGTAAEMDAARPVIERYTPRATRSMDVFWELSDPEAQKWSGISFVLDLLDVDPARRRRPRRRGERRRLDAGDRRAGRDGQRPSGGPRRGAGGHRAPRAGGCGRLPRGGPAAAPAARRLAPAPRVGTFDSGKHPS